MKKKVLITFLLAVMLLLVACQNRLDLGQSDRPGIIKLPEVPVKETPKQETIEEPQQEEILPPVQEQVPELIHEYTIKSGESFTYGKYTVKFKSILSSSDVVLDVNGEQIQFTETRTSDIIGDMLLTYKTSNFNNDGTIVFIAEDFKLGTDEYIMKYKDSVTAHGEKVKLENIQYDEGFKAESIWVSIASDAASSQKILEGKEIVLGKVKIKVLKIKDGQSLRQYAHIRITAA